MKLETNYITIAYRLGIAILAITAIVALFVPSNPKTPVIVVKLAALHDVRCIDEHGNLETYQLSVPHEIKNTTAFYRGFCNAMGQEYTDL